jgi:hypothetical protein
MNAPKIHVMKVYRGQGSEHVHIQKLYTRVRGQIFALVENIQVYFNGHIIIHSLTTQSPLKPIHTLD